MTVTKAYDSSRLLGLGLRASTLSLRMYTSQDLALWSPLCFSPALPPSSSLSLLHMCTHTHAHACMHCMACTCTRTHMHARAWHVHARTPKKTLGKQMRGRAPSQSSMMSSKRLNTSGAGWRRAMRTVPCSPANMCYILTISRLITSGCKKRPGYLPARFGCWNRSQPRGCKSDLLLVLKVSGYIQCPRASE